MSFNINLPDDMSLDDIKEIIDYVDKKQTRRKIKDNTIKAAAIPAAITMQWQAENFGISPPILHWIIDTVTGAVEAIGGTVKAVNRSVNKTWDLKYGRKFEMFKEIFSGEVF